jgi:Trypsin-co-occurring domain 1
MVKSAEATDRHDVEIMVEVHPRSVSGDLAPRVAVPEQFRLRAGEIADSVAEVADQFRAKLAQILRHPTEPGWGVDSIEIGFDLAVQAEAGVVIAKASTSATFSAKLTLKVEQDSR